MKFMGFCLSSSRKDGSMHAKLTLISEAGNSERYRGLQSFLPFAQQLCLEALKQVV